MTCRTDNVAIRVGAFPRLGGRHAGSDSPSTLSGLRVDHLCAGDHVSFVDGSGSDGLVSATALLAAHSAMPVYVGLYLLPLRHPVTVARQLATIAELAPGRLMLGVGIGGEDRHEVEICGVDPRTRGRRMDECLDIVCGLMGGEPLTYHGEFFRLDGALILPQPSPRIPIIVGGRSDAAVRRAARLGDGWLAIWVSARRFREAVLRIEDEAVELHRDPALFRHGLNVWCGFGEGRAAARRALAESMEAFYHLPFESFERYCPHGSPDEVAQFLAPYIDAGCSDFNLIPCAADADAAAEGVTAVRSTLRGTDALLTVVGHACREEQSA